MTSEESEGLIHECTDEFRRADFLSITLRSESIHKTFTRKNTAKWSSMFTGLSFC